MTSMDYADADEQAPLYFRTTEEMLSEFSYLGRDKAEEVVITNPRMIADRIEAISPVRPDNCPPVIENSDVMLREICTKRAHELYGENLPKVVEDRMNTELDAIIGHGYAVLYIIAQKLVWKSREDGYLVGSRGSVGSSFAAFLAGITEVNSLAPHYRCPKCHYTDFDSEGVQAYAGGSGCDMPDRKCPVCGANLEKDGFDIPFETFLGFGGGKEPTHFEYHSIDHNLLKLDELGHDDPTMIRSLEDLCGIDLTKVPLHDEKVMSLFTSPEALGLTPSDLFGWRVGSLGIPEFGTGFVEKMLVEAKPEKFSDLIRIAGLGHGTDVWLGNAQTLIQNGTCTISEAICCRGR